MRKPHYSQSFSLLSMSLCLLLAAGIALALCPTASAETIWNDLTVGPPMINSVGTSSVTDEGCGYNTHVERRYAAASDAGIGYIMLEGYIKPDFWCLAGVGVEEFSAETRWEHADITCVNPGTYSVAVSGTLTGLVGMIGQVMSTVGMNYVRIYLQVQVLDGGNAVVFSEKRGFWQVNEFDPLGWNHHWEFDHEAVNQTFTGVPLDNGTYKCRVRLIVEMRLGTKYIYTLLQAPQVWGVVQFAPPQWSPYGPWTWVDDAGFSLDSITFSDETPDTVPPVTSISVEDPTTSCGKRITLSAQDNDGGYGVDATKYRIGSGGWTDYAVPFVAPYSTSVEFYSTDVLGNVEAVQTYTTDPPYELETPVVTCTPGINYIDLSWGSVPRIFTYFSMTYLIYRDGMYIDYTSDLHWRDTNPGIAQRCYSIVANNYCAASPASQSVCAQIPYVRLTGGSINGNAVSSGVLELTTYTSVPLNGYLTIEANNIAAPINLAPLVLVRGWGDHAASWSTLSGTLPQGITSHTAVIDMTAASIPGDYFISAAFALEMGGANVASLTNWQVPGSPHWDDGHDMADWGTDAYAQSLAAHQVTTLYETPGGLAESILPAAMVRIAVLPRGAIAGNVSETSGGGAYGVPVDLFQEDNFVATTSTDFDGHYEFAELIPGDYDISILPPLSCVADAEDKSASVASGDTTVVDFLLTRRDIVASQQGMGFWKHQANVVFTDGSASELMDSMCLYLERVRRHFNNNPVNPITAYIVDSNLSCLENLAILTENLNLRINSDTRIGDLENNGSSAMFNKPSPNGSVITMQDRAIQQFIAMLLNVVSDRLGLFAEVTADGLTVSQAITYCNYLITDPAAFTNVNIHGDPIDPDSRGVSSAYELAKDIAEWINLGYVIPVSVIPASTPQIAYRGNDSNRPTMYRLDQNFPNPFNPRTSIRFALPEAGYVTIEVFDVAGRKITTLINAYLESGEHRVDWDGTDATGATVATGVYFYRMRTDAVVETRKMLLIK